MERAFRPEKIAFGSVLLSSASISFFSGGVVSVGSWATTDRTNMTSNAMTSRIKDAGFNVSLSFRLMGMCRDIVHYTPPLVLPNARFSRV